MAFDPTRLRDNIISDLFPNFAELDPALQAQISEKWGLICGRIIDENKEADVVASLDGTGITGTNNPLTDEVTGNVNDGSVSGHLE